MISGGANTGLIFPTATNSIEIDRAISCNMVPALTFTALRDFFLAFDSLNLCADQEQRFQILNLLSFLDFELLNQVKKNYPSVLSALHLRIRATSKLQKIRFSLMLVGFTNLLPLMTVLYKGILSCMMEF